VRFHEKAWLAWAVAASAVALSIDNPLVSVLTLAVMAMVGGAGATREPEGRSFGVMVKIGLAFVALRVVLFALTGHTGDTTLVTVPEFALPKLLGGFSIGGRITGEVVAQSMAEGLKVATFLAVFGIFVSVVDPARILRMLPRRLHDAGLVVGIALTFVPTIMRTAADVRDAQRLRGARARGLRSLRPLVVPVVSGALERSLALAASMESRGFGRARTPTRIPSERVDGWDRAVIVAASATIVLVAITRGIGAAQWYPYPVLTWPTLDARLIACAVSLGAPLAIALARDARMARADVLVEASS
jgi:energy-coupling factor transport system permease protein